MLLHGSFAFVLFLLSTLAVLYPNKEALCNVLTVVFVIILTGGGVFAAVVMFNKVVRQHEALTAQQQLADNGLEDHSPSDTGRGPEGIRVSTSSNPMTAYDRL